MNHLIAIAVMAMASLGVFVSMGEGMILEPLKRRLLWIEEPFAHGVYSCPRCMVSVWGSLALLCLYLSGMPVNWYLWPVYALCAVGLQEMLDR